MIIDIEKCKKCNEFFVGGEMGELNKNPHNRYPMCNKAKRNVIWNMKNCPKDNESEE